jgi:5-methylcytosine-specific restriction enzyme A
MAVGVRLRAYILRRDEYRCVWCGAEPDRFYLQADHVIPRAKGGKTHPANLVTACAECNLRKTDRVVEVPLPVLALLARETGFRWSDLRSPR